MLAPDAPGEHGLTFLVNCSILFTELPLLARPAAAKAAGFDAVEFWWPFPEADPGPQDVDAFVGAVQDAGVQLVGLNFAAGNMPAGDRGLVSWVGRETDFRATVNVAVSIGERLGVRAFNALYGNRLDGVSGQEQDELAVQNLTTAAKSAAGIGATLLIEPVSGAPRYPLLTAADVVDVIERVEAAGATNVALLADLYHLTVNGDDLDAVIDRYAARIGHVQIADAPGRHEPGTGRIDTDRYLRRLSDAGYTGWVGLEYNPSTTSERSFDWLPRSRRSAAGVSGARLSHPQP